MNKKHALLFLSLCIGSQYGNLKASLSNTQPIQQDSYTLPEFKNRGKLLIHGYCKKTEQETGLSIHRDIEKMVRGFYQDSTDFFGGFKRLKLLKKTCSFDGICYNEKDNTVFLLRTTCIRHCNTEGRIIRTFRKDFSRNNLVYYGKERLFFAGKNNSIIVLNPKAKKGIKPQVLEGHNDKIRTLCFGKDQVVFSGSKDKTIRTWNLKTGKCTQILTGHTNIVYSLCYIEEENILASASRDHTIKIWNAEGGKCIQTLTFDFRPYILCYAPDMKRLFCTDQINEIKTWYIEKEKEEFIKFTPKKTFKGHYSHIPSLLYAGNGVLISGGISDEEIIFWNVKTGEPIKELTAKGEAYSFCFTGNKLITSGEFCPMVFGYSTSS